MNRELLSKWIFFPEEKPAVLLEISTYTKEETDCVIGNCSEKKWVKRMCKRHYRKFYQKYQSITRCDYIGCPRTAHRRGLCQVHLMEDVKEKREQQKASEEEEPKCTMVECEAPIYRKKHGLCMRHYKRMMRNSQGERQTKMVNIKKNSICGTTQLFG